MLSVVNDVLDFNKMEAGKMVLAEESAQLSGFVARVEQFFRGQFEEKQLGFTIHCSPGLDRYFITDFTRLNQVLSNLLSNALKFTRTGNVQLDVKLMQAGTDSAVVHFAVTDTGIGISPAQAASVFDSFTQADADTNRKYGGTGLGLSISKKIVQLMGGELKLQSSPGKGSCFFFTIELPFGNQPARTFFNNNSAQQLENLKGLRVLVAEDNPVNMMLTQRFLEKWNIRVFKAANGIEAVEFFSKEKFDLLLIDLEMPEMDGYLALEAIRKIDAHTPAIAFTAAVFGDMLATLRAKGFNDYLQKPFRPEDLQRKIADYVNPIMNNV
jgi:CheY-like chemotaxis protein